MSSWFRTLVVAITLLTAYASAAQTTATAPKTVTQHVMTVTAKVERVDKIARSLTVKTDDGLSYTIFCGKELKVFDELKTGDTVTARFNDSYVATLKPGAKMQQMTDTTVDAKKNATASADVMQQIKMVVTVDAVDAPKGLITYRTADNRVVSRLVQDPKILTGLKRGDVVEVTYTRERALELTKKK